MEKKLKILRDISLIKSNPSSESDYYNYLRSSFKKYNLESEIDNLGNIYFIKKSKNKKAKNLAIEAHIDDVGFVSTGIDNKGFVSFEPKGGVIKKWLIGHKLNIEIKSNLIPGVVVTPPPHLIRNNNSLNLDDSLKIDFGFTSKENAKKMGFEIGQDIYWDSHFWSNDSRVFMNATDNKVGTATLVNLIHNVIDNNYNFNIYFSFISQEEVGLRGAKVASQKINPDLVIVLDTSPAMDISNSEMGHLDSGPFIRYMDRGYIPPKKVNNFIIETAKKSKIKLQPYISPGGTDALEWSLQGTGNNIIQLGILSRNIHTSIGSFSMNDFNELNKLTEDILNSKDLDKLFRK